MKWVRGKTWTTHESQVQNREFDRIRQHVLSRFMHFREYLLEFSSDLLVFANNR